MSNCLCSVIVLWSVGWWWWWKEGRRWNPVPAHSLLFSKSTKESARLNVPIRRTNRYQQYYMPSQHTYCGRVWNLIQAYDVQSSDWKVYISTPHSPEVENFQMKIYYPAGDWTPDLLNQRQTCYHLSQRSESYCEGVPFTGHKGPWGMWMQGFTYTQLRH